MIVALVINGIPDPQLSMACGIEALTILLADRQSRGCTVTPSEQAVFGIEYRIQHPNHGIEVVYLTQFPDPGDDLDLSG